MNFRICPECDGIGFLLTGDKENDSGCDECGGSEEIEDEENDG